MQLISKKIISKNFNTGLFLNQIDLNDENHGLMSKNNPILTFAF